MSAAAVSVRDYPQWRSAVTPRELFHSPVHRWYVFPHSYAPSLVKELVEEWELTSGQTLLDPFVGAGTSLVAACDRGLKGIGLDLSPLAVFVSDVKANAPTQSEVTRAWASVRRRSTTVEVSEADPLLGRAFDPRTLRELTELRIAIGSSRAGTAQARRFLLLVLLGSLPRFSRLVRKGGWLSEVSPELGAGDVRDAFEERLGELRQDLSRSVVHERKARVELADARRLPVRASSCEALVSSPPYVNRHDYTRVFGVELAFAFLDSLGLRALRYQTIHSHPEAKPSRPRTDYVPPRTLANAVAAIAEDVADQRVARMVAGYFEDLYCCLAEMRRVLRPGGRAALVLGNVQYAGIEVPVDLLTAELAARNGLCVTDIRAARYRGNSAQQMRAYGRTPARESVLLLRK